MTTDETTPPLSEAHRDLLARFRQGQRAALARVISIVENQREGFQSLLHELHPDSHGARRIGITGPPGAGKSTLTSALIQRFTGRDETVGVIAVDPTSPYTGGALLGDRIRMNEVAQGGGVFIRSMATRGALGGIAAATREVMDVLAAYGFDVIIVETVGVGQSELDIAAAADTTAVVLVPESGDSIQTMKAGLMEAADLFIINKADRPGAQRLAKEVETMLHLRMGESLRNVPAHHGVQLRRAETARSKLAARRAREAGESEAREAREGEAREGEGRAGFASHIEARDRSDPNDPGDGEISVTQSAATTSDTSSASGDRSAPNELSKRGTTPSDDDGGGAAPGASEAPGAPGASGASEAPDAPGAGPWSIPVLLASAERGDGLDELVERLDAHAGWLEASGELERRRRARLEERVRDAVQLRLLASVWHESDGGSILEEALDDLSAGTVTPYEVAERIVRSAAR